MKRKIYKDLLEWKEHRYIWFDFLAPLYDSTVIENLQMSKNN